MTSQRSACPISCALELLGDRWSLLIIRDMLFAGKRHFREFMDSEEGIATNILTDRLSRLERCGIVDRQQDPASGRQVIYSPTAKGAALKPLLVELFSWGECHAAEDGEAGR